MYASDSRLVVRFEPNGHKNDEQIANKYNERLQKLADFAAHNA